MPKAKLSITEQIEHMKLKKGIMFNIVKEEAAHAFLQYHNYYFRVKAYAKNYEQYKAEEKQGKYVNLEFAYLQDLSTIDMHFRKCILKMTIDIEHFLKTQMMRDFESNEKEDGYEIVAEYFKLYPKVKENVDRLAEGSLCFDLIAKYKDEFALWNIIEVLSFGDFINLYRLYYSKYHSKNDMSKLLWSARIMRNAAAHNNCLLNSLKNPYTYDRKKISKNWEVTKFISEIPGIKEDSRVKKMANPVIHDFLVTLYLFDAVVSSEMVKLHTFRELKQGVTERFSKNAEYYSKNEVIKSNFEFISKVVDFYCRDRV